MPAKIRGLIADSGDLGVDFFCRRKANPVLAVGFDARWTGRSSVVGHRVLNPSQVFVARQRSARHRFDRAAEVANPLRYVGLHRIPCQRGPAGGWRGTRRSLDFFNVQRHRRYGRWRLEPGNRASFCLFEARAIGWGRHTALPRQQPGQRSHKQGMGEHAAVLSWGTCDQVHGGAFCKGLEIGIQGNWRDCLSLMPPGSKIHRVSKF